MKAVVVTGVATGIGRASAALLAARGFHVFGGVRKAADAEKLSARLGSAFTPLVFDLTDDGAVHDAAKQVRERLGTDDALSGTPGRVVNLTSVGGKLGAPFLGPYVASKFGLEGLSESLRRELQFYGIDVIMVAPGHVATPIWDKAEEMDGRPYAALPIAPALRKFREFFIAEGKKGFPPEKIAGVIFDALTAARPQTRYAVVPGKLQNWTIPRLLPARIVDRVIAAQLGLKRQS